MFGRHTNERPQWAGVAMRWADGTLVSFEMDGSIEVTLNRERRRDDSYFDLGQRPFFAASDRFTLTLATDGFVMRHFNDWNPSRPPAARPAGELDAAYRALERGPAGE